MIVQGQPPWESKELEFQLHTHLRRFQMDTQKGAAITVSTTSSPVRGEEEGRANNSEFFICLPLV